MRRSRCAGACVIAAGTCSCSWRCRPTAYRTSHRSAPDHADLHPLVDALLEANVDRLLWASDWPHSEMTPPLPLAADLVDLLAAWVPDEATRARICVANPTLLYFH